MMLSTPPNISTVPISAPVNTTVDGWIYADTLKGVRPLGWVHQTSSGGQAIVDVNLKEIAANALRYEIDARLPVGTDVAGFIASPAAASVVAATQPLLCDVFGAKAVVRAEILNGSDGGDPRFALVLRVARDQRAQRSVFVERYVREVILSPDTPLPVLTWEYEDGISA